MEEKSLYNILKKAEEQGASSELYKIYHAYITHNSAVKRKPYSALLELTPVCNFKCKVCYIRMTPEDIIQKNVHVMNFQEWKYYIDELFEMGITSFTLSGGECTIHPEFKLIYQYIYDKGGIIVIMTNGSCLTKNIFDLFSKKPPFKICITLYGMSARTYQDFCCNGDAFNKVLNNISELEYLKLPVILQYTCGKENVQDLYEAYRFAKSKNMPLPHVNSLIAYNKCDLSVIEMHHADDDAYRETSRNIYCDKNNVSKEEYNIMKNDVGFADISQPIIRKGLSCNAGKNFCIISWKGEMKACVTMDAFCINPHTVGGLKKCWDMMVDWADNVPRIIECQRCIFRNRCKHCTAFHYNDTKEFGKVSPRFCYKIQHPDEALRLQQEYDLMISENNH